MTKPRAPTLDRIETSEASFRSFGSHTQSERSFKRKFLFPGKSTTTLQNSTSQRTLRSNFVFQNNRIVDLSARDRFNTEE